MVEGLLQGIKEENRGGERLQTLTCVLKQKQIYHHTFITKDRGLPLTIQDLRASLLIPQGVCLFSPPNFSVLAAMSGLLELIGSISFKVEARNAQLPRK